MLNQLKLWMIHSLFVFYFDGYTSNSNIKKVDWISLIGIHDPHKSLPLIKSVLNKLCDKHIPEKTIKYQFQPPWFDADCEKVLLEKEKWRSRANPPIGTDEDREKFRKLRKKLIKSLMKKCNLMLKMVQILP